MRTMNMELRNLHLVFVQSTVLALLFYGTVTVAQKAAEEAAWFRCAAIDGRRRSRGGRSRSLGHIRGAHHGQDELADHQHAGE